MYRFKLFGEKLLWRFTRFVFDKDRGDCFCRYRSSHKNSELPAVVYMSHLETDDHSKAEAGDTYQGVTYYVNHGLSPYYQVSRASSSMMGITDSSSKHSWAITMNRFE
jgi:hypothetical protein